MVLQFKKEVVTALVKVGGQCGSSGTDTREVVLAPQNYISFHWH